MPPVGNTLGIWLWPWAGAMVRILECGKPAILVASWPRQLMQLDAQRHGMRQGDHMKKQLRRNSHSCVQTLCDQEYLELAPLCFKLISDTPEISLHTPDFRKLVFAQKIEDTIP